MKDFLTRAIHGGRLEDTNYPGPSYPIYLSSTFNQKGLDEFGEFMYSRSGNPTRSNLEEQVASLEDCQYVLATASGMAATAIALSFLQAGDKILINSNVYGGTWTYVSDFLKQKGIDYEIVTDFNQYDFDQVNPAVKAVFIETPSNPLVEVTDIAAVCQAAKAKGLTVIVDNTFMTAYLQEPLKLGADIVVYSATKYYGGHSDLIAGLIALNDEARYNDFKKQRKLYGSPLAPFDCFLLSRGIKTMPLRIDRQEANTKEVVEFLKNHPACDRVYYTGLDPESKAYAIQTKQAKGFGSLISFELNEGYDLNTFFKALQVFDLAVSLGGVESLICLPANMTHEDYEPELLDQIGIKANLLRVAIGIEGAEDLKEDLSQAFEAAKK